MMQKNAINKEKKSFVSFNISTEPSAADSSKDSLLAAKNDRGKYSFFRSSELRFVTSKIGFKRGKTGSVARIKI